MGDTADLVVVGAGVSGLTAARRAQQLGLRVTLVEKTDSGPGISSGRMSAGVVHAAYVDPLRPAEDIRRTLEWATGGTVRAELLDAFSSNVRRALEFLVAEGAVYGQSGPLEWVRRSALPMSAAPPGTPFHDRWPDMGPDRLLSGMWRAFVDGGGDYRQGTRVTGVLFDGDRVAGVTSDKGDIPGASVLLADGGFHANKDLAERFWGSSEYFVRASAHNTGDALAMAEAIGADLYNCDQFYAHLHHRRALDDDRFWLRPMLDTPAEGGLVVTSSGRRLGAQAKTFMHLNHEIMSSESPAGCWIVLDEIGWMTLGGIDGNASIRASYEGLGLEVVEADGVGELAAKIGAQEDVLRQAIETHNAEVDRPFGLPDSGEGQAHPPVVRVPVLKVPFYAIPMAVGVTFPLGGILVNEHAQVLRGGSPIDGLYAAGNAMAGLQGGPDFGYSGGWAQASVFAMLAADHVESQARLQR